MNYTQLTQAITDFAVDAEATFISHIPEFIVATEKRIYNDAPDLPSFQVDSAPTITANVGTITMPADFLSVDTLAIISASTRVMLLSKTPDFIQAAYPVTTGRGTPRYYAVTGPLQLTLGPIPDVAYTCELSYLAYPESITVAASGTTWLGDNYEYALLYGSLRDAAIFLKEEADIVAMYNAAYTEALGQVTTFATTRGPIEFRHKQDFRKLPR